MLQAAAAWADVETPTTEQMWRNAQALGLVPTPQFGSTSGRQDNIPPLPMATPIMTAEGGHARVLGYVLGLCCDYRADVHAAHWVALQSVCGLNLDWCCMI